MAGLYVHVPFCHRACPYCDFDFEVSRSPPIDEYLDGLASEWASNKEEVWRSLDHRQRTTVYIGGGTPSSLGSRGLTALIAWIQQHVAPEDVQEWTVEFNPEHLDQHDLANLRRSGVTRLSFGVQTFQSDGLLELGRAHRGELARAAIRASRTAGLATCVDLMVGWRQQNQTRLQADLDELSLVDHVSIYGLTVEENTPWPQLVARGLRENPDEAVQADLLVAAEQGLKAMGFEHYEISNYARPGQRSRHNSGYWQQRDYLGLGPSAHSARYHLDGSVTRAGNRRGFRDWLANSGAWQEKERLSPEDCAAESLWLGLRQLEGLPISDFLQRHPAVDREWLLTKCESALRRGNVELVDSGARVRMPNDRWAWHNELGLSLLG